MNKLQVLPPMRGEPAPTQPASREPQRSGKPAGKVAGRFGVLNGFVDRGAKLVDTTAQACWLVLFRETQRDGLATVSHSRIAQCIGVDRKTVTRAVRRLTDAGLVTIKRHGGWGRGPSTYRVRGIPKLPRKEDSQVPPVVPSGAPTLSTTGEHY
jgi:DNA-binding transcriptional ArsR family regulator